LGGDDRVLPL